jgi:signal transduction histidine kinase
MTTTLILIASLVIYLALAALALWSRGRGPAAYWLAAYVFVCALWAFLQLALRLNWVTALRADLAAHLPALGALLLAALFVHVTRTFARLTGPGWNWSALGAGCVAAPLLLDLLSLPNVLVSAGSLLVTRERAAFALAVIGWGVLMGAADRLTANVYRRTQQPLHRNRLIYWLPALALLSSGDGLLFGGFAAPANALHLLGAGVAAYASLTHHLPDVRQAVRAVLSHLVTAVLILLAFIAGFVALQTLFRASPGDVLMLALAALALVLAWLSGPLRRRVQSTVTRLIPAAGYDPSRIVREYSASISNILEVDRLAHVALSLVHAALGAQRGALFLVDRAKSEGIESFQLRCVGGLRAEAVESGHLSAASPLAEYLNRDSRPLTQYDVDFLPRFRSVPEPERAWLTGLSMDVYVPIYSKGEWIGLLALGPKGSRDRYYDSDLTLLSTLADQTTVALENARLVDNLRQLYSDLRDAYVALDEANQRLEHLDRAKSDFITVLSHELRTPLGLLLGYGQLLADDPVFRERPDHQHLMDGMQKGAARLRELIEAMLDMAAIDNRTLKLYRHPAPILAVLQHVCSGYESALAERRLRLEISDSVKDLPRIEADTDALGKAFHHLVGNAIKYTPDEGRITLWGRALEAGHRRLAEPGIEVVVADTGIGIDPQFHELIFNKFYQTGEVASHSSGKTKFKGGGPGLGLTIARGIVEAHGGQVWVESPGYDEDRCPGSQFHVVLPLRRRLTTEQLALRA